MKKSDLNIGNVVELRNGDKLLFFFCFPDDILVNLKGRQCRTLDSYHDNLTATNDFIDDDFIELDIMKVYKDYTFKELLWERKEKQKPKLTEDEKVILRNVPKEYKWFARDINGCLYIYENKPEKGISIWEASGLPMTSFDHLFQFIKWEDEEPYLIEKLLEGEKK